MQSNTTSRDIEFGLFVDAITAAVDYMRGMLAATPAPNRNAVRRDMHAANLIRPTSRPTAAQREEARHRAEVRKWFG